MTVIFESCKDYIYSKEAYLFDNYSYVNQLK